MEPLAQPWLAFYGQSMTQAERDHTVTIVSDKGGSVASIPLLTAEETARITDQQDGQRDAEEG